MMKNAFEEAYNRLNTAQKEAVDAIEGPVMVIAGPGTGKTQILTLRVANILKNTDTTPQNILALTFTEAGARAMRERLHNYIGSAAYRVEIHTFHEFAGTLIRKYPDAYDRAVGGKPATDLEKVAILETIIETEGIRALRPHGNHSFYIKPIMGALSLMKREYITPDMFSTIISKQEAVLSATPKLHEKGAHKGKVRSEYQKLEKEIAKNKELLFIYRAYDAALTEGNLYDFEDMIFETVHALEKNEDMLRDLQEKYHYILADEHQDVNGSQNRILELLASFHDRPNLFVVGDEKQAIFRFQGASLENFLYFEEQFSHTKTIALTQNYRSTQNILDISHSLITEVESPADALRVPLESNATEKGLIELRSYHHEAVEDAVVAKEIESLISSGVRAEEIALIVRSNKEVESYAHLLRSRKIKVNATADGDILSHPITTTIRSLLTAVVLPEDEEALFEVLHAPYWGIERSDLVHIFRQRSFTRPLSHILGDTTFLRSLTLTSVTHCTNVYAVLNAARERMVTEAPHRVLEMLLKESGCIDYVIARDPWESGRIVRRIYDEIEGLVRTREATTLSDVLKMFNLRLQHGLPLNAPYIHTNTHAVSVMTAHKSKGLEFEHVFVPHLNDSKWGDRSRPTYFRIPVTHYVDDSKFDELDDERKLLYVAMTRAKKGLHLSYAEESIEGRTLGISPLLEALHEPLVCKIDTEKDETEFDPLQGLGVRGDVPVINRELLQNALLEYGLSATSLNNYLRSPWDYLYRNVFRIPEIQGESAQFGTALHDTLRRITQYRTEKKELPDTSLVKTYLELELQKMPLTVHEYTRLLQRGLEALIVYLEHMSETLPEMTKEEVKFQAEFETGIEEIPKIILKGNLDRLDYDTEGNLIQVVDYKSGKPRTRGYIEGTTKDSTGDYKRQLTFYALLLSLQDDDRLHTRRGLLSFIESDEKGKIHNEPYVITDEEIEALKAEIRRVVLEIAQGAFLNAPCDPLSSDYCHLVEQLK